MDNKENRLNLFQRILVWLMLWSGSKLGLNCLHYAESHGRWYIALSNSLSMLRSKTVYGVYENETRRE